VRRNVLAARGNLNTRTAANFTRPATSGAFGGPDGPESGRLANAPRKRGPDGLGNFEG
jgi:hypothetical protein